MVLQRGRLTCPYCLMACLHIALCLFQFHISLIQTLLWSLIWPIPHLILLLFPLHEIILQWLITPYLRSLPFLLRKGSPGFQRHCIIWLLILLLRQVVPIHVLLMIKMWNFLLHFLILLLSATHYAFLVWVIWYLLFTWLQLSRWYLLNELRRPWRIPLTCFFPSVYRFNRFPTTLSL